MRTTHIKSNVVNNGVPKLPTSDAIYYGEIAINYGASGETLSIKNSNDEIVPFSSDNAINKAFEVHAQSLIDLDGRIVELKDTKVESEEFNKIVSDLNQKLSVASESLDNLYNEIVNLTDKINENEVVISESLCDLDKRIKKIDTSYNNPTLTAITFNSIAWVTDVPAAGGTATKDNCTFEVYAKYDNGISVDISPIVTVEGELVVEKTTIKQRHEVGQLTLTTSYSGLTATGNVTAYQEAFDPSTEPLTFKISSGGTINWKAPNTAATKTIDYKVNDGEWTSITSNIEETAPSITVNSGDKIQFRGNNAQYATNSFVYNSFSGSTASFELEGNIMSLIYGDDFKNRLTISSDYTFTRLFRGCTKLVSAENLVLPATTLANYCYQYMFDGCTSLTTAPALPATALTSNCYSYMFNKCTSLATAPELPATTLVDYCYSSMFKGCTNLTTAPELPARTLADSCYDSMFNGTNVLPDCSNIDFASSTVVASRGLRGLFSGTKVTDNDLERLLPKNDNGRYYLPATTLANYCYQNMFRDCTSLSTAPELPTTTLADDCYQYMFYGCTSLTTAPELPATTLKSYCYQNMFYKCTSLTIAPALPARTLANYCYQFMFNGCTSLTTAPALPATTLEDSCYRSMFNGCTSLTTAPELPATTLADNCYSSMFYGCTSLNYIKCLATDISANRCTDNWVGNVASTGTFVKNPNVASWTTGDSGIPTGWTVEDNQEPLTFSILSAGTINWTASNSAVTKTIDYKLNDGEWTSITSNTGTSAPTINVAEGDKIQFRGNNEQYANSSSRYNSFSGSTASFEAEGNIMSLIYGDDFKNNLTISSTYALAGLFRNCTKLVSAENLLLPATTLANYCYSYMFYNCTSLTTAPELPATTLANYCYSYMFYNCSKLTTAPALPATTLANNCYDSMFWNCVSLTTAPALPATTLANNCYNSMFRGCTSLTTAPALPATTLTQGCYSGMFDGCISLRTAPALPATTLASDCYSSMFNGTNVLPDCSNIDFASSTVVASGGLKGLFSGTKVTDNDLERLLPKNNNGKYYLPATTLANYCYQSMFSNCKSLTTAPELPATTLASGCYGSMFYGCKSLTTAPELPATTLVGGCYRSMFNGCTSLNYIKCLATNISAYNCTYSWVSGVASTGTFVKNPDMVSWTTDVDGIPTGWTIEDAS